MQTEYRKEGVETCLWILAETPVMDTYVEKMLQFHPGEGRLEFSKRQEEGQDYYCYKITGKKALHGIYAMMSIGEKQIKNILGQIFTAVERGQEYLLCEDDFVLQPQYMFATLPSMEMELCYVPGYHVPLKEQLESFFEYLLNRVDYEDKKAVELLYDCYMLCVKKQGGLKEIRERVERMEKVEREMKPEIFAEEREERLMERDSVTEVPPSYVAWLTDRFLGKKKKVARLAMEERRNALEGREREAAPKEMPDSREELMERTVLLSVSKTKEVPLLTNEITGEVIKINKLPFYIGSVTQYADYTLKEEGVSRIHCCITQRGENYYLSDLNSTNGTYLNQRELIPGKEELLSTGACIRVAKTEFYVNLPCH